MKPRRRRIHSDAFIDVRIAVIRTLERKYGPGRGNGYRSGIGWRAFDCAAAAVDRRIGWHRVATPVGLLVLIGVRNALRKRNLYDTDELPTVDLLPLLPWRPEYRTQRSPDGSYNDLDRPQTGRAGSRFGRNSRLDLVRREPIPDLLEPNPRLVSRELMTRHEFQAASHLNVLVAAWLQFMIHDWFSHGRGPSNDHWHVPLVDGDDWGEDPMIIPLMPRDRTRPDGADLPTFLNVETHWWDGSSLYGTSLETQRRVRSGKGGKLRLGAGARLDIDPERDPRNVPGWWLGMSMLARLFTLEHNAICDRLASEYPAWGDEELFQRARLINAAVLAKIHTVEWTPAVISHPTTRIAMRANWFGLVGERLTEQFGRLSNSEVVSGIPGSMTNHYGVPFSLTEEFTSVYRMHPLLPDDFTFRSLADDVELEAHPFRGLTGPQVTPIEQRISLANLIYSFGRLHPGWVRLNNFPRDLQTFVRPDGKVADLAATDVLRTRELGLPRYNDFRRSLHLEPAENFETLTDVPRWAAEMRAIYGDIERVDLTVGMFAEPLPAGFAFSDTAFRIFILMASRRLNSDRFFTTDFNDRVYTPAGMKWLDETDMSALLVRHCPEIAPALRGLDNAFTPFNAAGAASAASPSRE